MRSCLYEGRVRHGRSAPVRHVFEYGLCLLYLELDELETVFRGRWLWSSRRPNVAWFRRADYLGDPGVSLDQAVRDLVEARTGSRPAGPIGVLTQVRTLGHVFNPVSFYYCWDPSRSRVEVVVAEIENTPWRERHAYVVRAGEPVRFEKDFHVSPFMDMDLAYEWRFSDPAERLEVSMRSESPEHGGFFRATLSLERRSISGPALARALVLHPLQPLRVVLGIYWNALRLWWKGAPFFPHPRWRTEVSP